MVVLATGVFGTAVQADGDGCKPLEFGGNRFTVCQIDAGRSSIELFLNNENKQPYGSFSALASALASDGKQLQFAMNAGMYNRKLAPIGLYVEDGKQLKKANTRNGPGNFHLKPNGVFYVSSGKAGVLETGRYLKLAPQVQFASQSGPMLVINGKLHPKFKKASTSRKRRNGVGVKDGGTTVVFAISEGAVTFYEFGSLFRDELGTRNALFFDGTVSSLHSTDLNRSDWGRPMGPIVGVAGAAK